MNILFYKAKIQNILYKVTHEHIFVRVFIYFLGYNHSINFIFSALRGFAAGDSSGYPKEMA